MKYITAFLILIACTLLCITACNTLQNLSTPSNLRKLTFVAGKQAFQRLPPNKRCPWIKYGSDAANVVRSFNGNRIPTPGELATALRKWVKVPSEYQESFDFVIGILQDVSNPQLGTPVPPSIWWQKAQGVAAGLDDLNSLCGPQLYGTPISSWPSPSPDYEPAPSPVKH